MSNYKSQKQLGALDDLFILLEQLEQTIGISIVDEDFIIGRQQLFYTFFHEVTHAFITQKARWLYDLPDEEIDFVDEVAVRVIMDGLIKHLDLLEKINPFFEMYLDHKTGVNAYGYNMKVEEYEAMAREWNNKYLAGYDIDGFCRYIHDFYRENKQQLYTPDKSLLKEIEEKKERGQ
jgi:hypothetical protein